MRHDTWGRKRIAEFFGIIASAARPSFAEMHLVGCGVALSSDAAGYSCCGKRLGFDEEKKRHVCILNFK